MRRTRTYLTSRRAHAETMHALEDLSSYVTHMHEHQLETLERLCKMAGELDRIETEVSEMSGSVDSATALLEKLAQLIRDNAGNPARLQKIADDLDAKGGELAAAVVANDPDIPAEEPPVEEPPVEEPPVDPPVEPPVDPPVEDPPMDPPVDEFPAPPVDENGNPI